MKPECNSMKDELLKEIRDFLLIAYCKSEEIEDFRLRLTMLNYKKGYFSLKLGEKTVAYSLGIYSVNLIICVDKEDEFQNKYIYENEQWELVDIGTIQQYIKSANYCIELEADAGLLTKDKEEYVKLIYENFYLQRIRITTNKFEPKEGDELLFYLDIPISVVFDVDMSKYKKFCYTYDFNINPLRELRKHYSEAGLDFNYLVYDIFEEIRACNAEIDKILQEEYGDWLIKHGRESRHKQYY